MGASHSSTNSSTNQTQNFTATPTNPQWVTNGVQGLAGKISDLGNIDPYSLVAGPDALQTQGAATAAGLGTPSAFGDAQSIFRNVAGAPANTMDAATGSANTYDAMTGQASSLLPGLSKYMSPYTNDVVNTALADYDVGAGQTRAQNQLALAQDDTFGGSGGAIQTALSNDAITRGRGTLAAGLEDQAFQTGANLSNEDASRQQQMTLANMDAVNQGRQFNAGAMNEQELANLNAMNQGRQFNATQEEQALQRRLAAGGAMTDAAATADANTRANATTQGGLGAMLQAIAQARAQAPVSLLADETGLLGNLPLSLFHGQTGTANSNTNTNSSSTKMGFGLSWNPTSGFSIGSGG